MSVSTTHVVSAAATDLLSAYDLHHSGADSLQSQRAEPAYQSPRQQGSPLSWPSNRRRMPNYREPSRDHRLVDRPAGQDTVEGVMVTIMFIGVYMNSVSSMFIRFCALCYVCD
jgi:hypothetical protein